VTEQKTIVIAEDDPEIAALLKRILSVKWRVLSVPDGSAAVLVAKRERPHLVILDVAMPIMDGFAAAQRIRALHGKGKTPIIFITARDTPNDRVTGIQSGARHYLIKPFSPKDVLNKVEGILKGS
jgi:DNA-binding response OmpR family regulator